MRLPSVTPSTATPYRWVAGRGPRLPGDSGLSGPTLALAAIAEATGGAVVPLGLAAADLGDLYLNRIEPIARRKRLVFSASERAERYGWFVLAALGLGLAGSWPRHRGREPPQGGCCAMWDCSPWWDWPRVGPRRNRSRTRQA